MDALASYQRKHLRGLAHGLKPAVLIGQDGITPGVVDSIRRALEAQELIKVKLLRFKEHRQEIAHEIESIADCQLVGMIGNVGIFYRQQPDVDKRTIELPHRES